MNLAHVLTIIVLLVAIVGKHLLGQFTTKTNYCCPYLEIC